MKKDLENRLVNFVSGIITLTENLCEKQPAIILTSQILRSATSSALNYGEAQNAQSKRDFIHKCSIVLKELRETSINLKIIKQNKLYLDSEQIENITSENNELLAIFTTILKTSNRYPTKR